MLRLNQSFQVLKRILCVADEYKVSTVCLWTSQPFHRRRRINEANPGLDKRLNLFRDGNWENVINDSEDGMANDDDLQADFMKVKEKNVFSASERQSEHERERLKRDIVKQKYFKTEKQPNFLTWAEKEQIRHLYSNDSVEWTTEKLSQSFPATESVIKKIIKSRWDQEDADKIARHDTSVQKNWNELQGGRLKIDVELKEHLMKFAKRNQAESAHIFLKNAKHFETGLTSVENVKGEFSHMVVASRGEISSCEQLQITSTISNQFANNLNRQEFPVKKSCSSDSDTFVLDLESGGSTSGRPPKTSKLVTLEQYKQAFNLTESKNEENVSYVTPQENQVQRQAIGLRPSAKESQLMLGREKLEMSGHLEYPEQIKIPKNKWKQGGTYKSGDCYYDDDGEFLYRVPGMR